MARKNSKDAENVFSRLRRVGEEALGTIFDEIKTNPSLRNSVERATEKIRANKQLLDKNLEHLLELINIPSKRELHELRERIERLTGQVVNLNLKLDRLLAELAKTKSKRRRGGKDEKSSKQ